MPTVFALASAPSHLVVIPELYITNPQLVAVLFELLQVMDEPRDHDPAQPTDFAGSSRPRERPERTPSSHLQLSNPNPPPVPFCHSPAATSPRKTILAPHVVVFCPEADPEDFLRRLKISTPPPRHRHHIRRTQQGKPFNPNTDPIPMRCATHPFLMQQVVHPRPTTPPLPIRESLQQVANYSITGRMILYNLQLSPVHRQLVPPLHLNLNHQETVYTSSTSSYACSLT
ncbi:uncharacterized protein F5891DRAFT_1194535 [Suillus fuscotomentosus]|uniref:Uncharacterized protein n=1 Tax=Suillus fuscotomentosus TaxID=1912939 RepID=A0AAD4DW33_9AGAM|nr:uncharacterized protein F5891DRAFT_1194535 [Suillus fuscotomentosus]KAG1895179.1 hypothetical protein F5891DRAFT_1194535 [Suillus fuscotomentosus]